MIFLLQWKPINIDFFNGIFFLGKSDFSVAIKPNKCLVVPPYSAVYMQTWKWNNCVHLQLFFKLPGLVWSIILTKLSNSPVYLVHSRAGLQNKTYSTHITEDKPLILAAEVLVLSACSIWSGRNIKKINIIKFHFTNDTIMYLS